MGTDDPTAAVAPSRPKALAAVSSGRDARQLPRTLRGLRLAQLGQHVFTRLFASSGDESLYLNRISGHDLQGMQVVAGPGWTVDTSDQSTLSSALNAHGRLV